MQIEEALMIAEAWVPWEPISELANRNWAVRVVHFEEANTEESHRRRAGASVAIVAAWETPEPQVGAWRIDFHNVQAYRRRSWNHPRHFPIASPDPHLILRACWEIFPSRYVLECLPTDPENRLRIDEAIIADYAKVPYHHYVIVWDIKEILEVVAASWQSEPLAEEWADFSATYPSW
jgi:hypothetical protein